MKTKTINRIISAKFDAWVESITDIKVKSLIQKNTICTGGCIASMLLQEDVNDFDFYFRNKETALAVAEYYIGVFKGTHLDCPKEFKVEEKDDRVRIMVRSIGVVEEELEEKEANINVALEPNVEVPNSYKPVFFSSNAITLTDKVQIVIRFYGEPEDIHKNYDYVHCTNYWTSWDRKTITNKEALESMLTRELKYIGSKYPLCSIIRMRKFLQREYIDKRKWSINAGQILKMALQLNELKLTDLAVLEEQLVGVDMAYFAMLLDAVKDADPAKINSNYLSEIIDRIF